MPDDRKDASRAEFLTRMVCGTMALEGQSLAQEDRDMLKQLIERKLVSQFQADVLAAVHKRHGVSWFEPYGLQWRTCDALARKGYLEHNGAAKGTGERFRVTGAGVNLLADV